MLRESEGVLLYTSSETIILAQIALTMALFSLIRSRGELILGISGGRKVISNWLLFFFFLHYHVMDIPYFLLLATGLTVKAALWGKEKKKKKREKMPSKNMCLN